MPMVALLVVMALGLAVLIVETARLVGERGGPRVIQAARSLGGGHGSRWSCACDDPGRRCPM